MTLLLLVSAISLAPEKTEIEAGAPVVIRVAAGIPAGATLTPPEEALPEDSPFSILSISSADLKIAAFALGGQTFPALEWRMQDGGKTSTLKSPPIKFKVTAPAADAPDADIRDIRPEIRPRRVLWPWFLLLAAAAAAGVWWRKRRLPAEAEREPAERRRLSPSEDALQRLERLLSSGLWESGDAKLFYSELADILRDCLQARFGLRAHAMTTGALTRQMRQLEIDPPVCREARAFLESCDLAKFARWKPLPPDKDRDVARLRQLIEATPLPAGERARVRG